MKLPASYNNILEKSTVMGFDMSSDPDFGSLLQTLVASKRDAHILELGTGTGLSLSWMVAGLHATSKITTLDNEENYLKIAREHIEDDSRVSIVCTDGAKWIEEYAGPSFNVIFADTWAGKFTHLEETLTLVAPGGFYIIDDLNPQKNWPEGHNKKVEKLIAYLNSREDFNLAHLNWSTGIIIMTRIARAIVN
ncbi:O-methyltransferase [Flavimarina sp. Hel_I_48]|uniref:O-methyltransferase n=1 Tax=Flavimarina sp. Hel_I_48 TaxID=1392488 RepID=UPI0004DF1143|nr:class I SAM-dependent methyltransferase [Flavimarina sp. Hel_I_48]